MKHPINFPVLCSFNYTQAAALLKPLIAQDREWGGKQGRARRCWPLFQATKAVFSPPFRSLVYVIAKEKRAFRRGSRETLRREVELLLINEE